MTVFSNPNTLIAAMKRFDRELRYLTTWQDWEQKPLHRYAIQYDGRHYPVKQIVSMATGLAPGDLDDIEALNRDVEAQGFTVARLGATVAATKPPAAFSASIPFPSPKPSAAPAAPITRPVTGGFGDFVRNFNLALSEEIATVRKSGGQKTFITDGRFLGKRDDRYIYSFSTDTELRFPDDTPVDIEYQGRKHSGHLVSIAGFDIILALPDHIGDSVPMAILFTAPWFLLEELKKRLLAALTSETANRTLAHRLLQPDGETQPVDMERAHYLLGRVERQLGTDQERKPDENQFRAVATTIGRPVSFIWGPPGTGKTRTLGWAVAALVEAGESVLVVAHSNTAVDEAMKSVAEKLRGSISYNQGKVLRYGGARPAILDDFPEMHVRGIARRENPGLVRDIEILEKRKNALIKDSRSSGASRPGIQDEIAAIRQQLEPLTRELRDKELALVRSATVVGCTLSKATIAPEVYDRRFTAVVVDEASMAYIPHVAFVATLADKRIAIFGDFRQLAPISQAESSLTHTWLDRDIFDQAGITSKVDAHQSAQDSRLVLLGTQYRMHPSIAEVPNRLFYNGQLRHGANVVEKVMPICQYPPAPGKPLVLQDISALGASCYSEAESHSRFNFVSALVAVSRAAEILDSVGHTAAPSIGIITPYNAQARLIHRILKDTHLAEQGVNVSTVHRLQGGERDVIIFDSVDGPPQAKAGKLLSGTMGSTAMRLTNVAITRAKGKFVGLVQPAYLRQKLQEDQSFRQVVDALANQAPLQTLRWTAVFAGTPCLGIRWWNTSQEARADLESALIAAREEVMIYWPRSLASHHFSATVLKLCDSKKVHFCLTTQPGRKDFYIGLENSRIWEARAPLDICAVSIDRKCLWVYLNPESSTGAVVRLDLPETTKLLYAFWRLIPDDERKQPSIIEKFEQGKSPIGCPCPRCGGSLWPSLGRYGVMLRCTASTCGFTKSMTPSDATTLARIMEIRCGACGQQVRGRKSYNGIFLSCSNYPECRWTKSVESLV